LGRRERKKSEGGSKNFEGVPNELGKKSQKTKTRQNSSDNEQENLKPADFVESHNIDTSFDLATSQADETASSSTGAPHDAKSESCYDLSDYILNAVPNFFPFLDPTRSNIPEPYRALPFSNSSFPPTSSASSALLNSKSHGSSDEWMLASSRVVLKALERPIPVAVYTGTFRPFETGDLMAGLLSEKYAAPSGPGMQDLIGVSSRLIPTNAPPGLDTMRKGNHAEQNRPPNGSSSFVHSDGDDLLKQLLMTSPTGSSQIPKDNMQRVNSKSSLAASSAGECCYLVYNFTFQSLLLAYFSVHLLCVF
jgi:hypothetical protein